MTEVCAIWGTPPTVSSGEGDFYDINSEGAGAKYRIADSAVVVATPSFC